MLPEALRLPLGDPARDAPTRFVGRAPLRLPVRRSDGVIGFGRHPARLPTFRSPRRILRDGLVGAVLTAAFLLVPVAVLAVTVGGALAGGIDPTTPLGYGGVLVGGTVTLLLSAALVYPLPAVLAGFARAGAAAGVPARLRTALSARRLRGIVSSGRYFYAWTVGSMLLLVGVPLASAGGRVGRLVGFFLLFYLEVAAVAAWSRGVGGNR
ncbi:hypothetical protein BRC97_11535 [Halobacteriales archaeon QS_6_71_20]|nr:MAG: hypothetical protein BRC97_11535 [Halobacteriales archaeon QS_6_71_20]